MELAGRCQHRVYDVRNVSNHLSLKIASQAFSFPALVSAQSVERRWLRLYLDGKWKREAQSAHGINASDCH